MASYSIKINHKYGTQTFQETKNTYDWVFKSLRKANIDTSNIKVYFSFDIGVLHCHTTSFEEFIENAYGCDEYSFGSFQIFIFEKTDIILSIRCSIDDLSISSNSKVMIDTVVNTLEATSIDENEINDLVSIEINAPITIGDNNVVGSNINSGNINLEGSLADKKTSKVKIWLESLAQNLLANWLWYLIGLVFSALVAYGIIK